MPPTSCLARVIVASAVMGCAVGPGWAQDVADFFRGKTISLIVASPPGSEYDTYARLIAKHLGAHIPATRRSVPANMPGTSGHVAAAHIYNEAPKDGTVIGAVLPQTITEPLWFGMGKVQHDPQKFIYLGSANSESYNCFVRSDTPIKSMRDALARVVVLGATTDRGPTRDDPALLNNLIGSRFRIDAKYRRDSRHRGGDREKRGRRRLRHELQQHVGAAPGLDSEGRRPDPGAGKHQRARHSRPRWARRSPPNTPNPEPTAR